jgi:molybdate transport repressor ModE-like protein
MSLDPRRLLIFRAVARGGSISGAARHLGWTQPAVSQHLSLLEREVGVPLVVRGPGGVDLTDAGTRLLVRADAVAGELHAAAEEMASLSQLRSGRVRLAAYPSAAATLVPRALHATATAHPGLEIGMVELEPPEATAAVLAGDVDVALAFAYDGPPRDTGVLAWRPIATEPVHLVVPPGHAAEGRPVSLADLAEEAWIGGCERCREHLLACCAAAGFVPRLRHTTDDYVVAENLVARSLGVTVLPESALTAYRHPDVVVVAMPALGERRVGLLHRPGAETVPATAALIEQLVEAVA